MGKLLPFLKRIGSLPPHNPEADAAAERAVIEHFAQTLTDTLSPEDLHTIYTSLTPEVPPTEEK